MKNDSVPRSGDVTEDEATGVPRQVEEKETKKAAAETAKLQKNREKPDRKKKKRNVWPLKALLISFVLSFVVNAGSELVLEDSEWWLAALLTLVILAIGVTFDVIGTATTSCDVEPFLAMASRKVKGAKTAVKLAKNRDVVSSVCCDIVGDVCGIVSGVCAAAIVVRVSGFVEGGIWNFLLSVLIYAVISTATITLKAACKKLAVNNAVGIVFGVAKILSIFSREG